MRILKIMALWVIQLATLLPSLGSANPMNIHDANLSVDLFVIGGGINGVGIAADASGRGLSVGLCEQGDLGSHTSSASSKLIHGGLRYLETFEFGLVKESLNERATLLKIAPHLVHPISFLMPFHSDQKPIRPSWLVHMGLLFYENWGGNHRFHYKVSPTPESPLKKSITHILHYSDCTVDDARLVILNALRAQEKGALILPRTRFVSAYREGANWIIQLENFFTHEYYTIRAKVIVNTAGAWVDSILNTLDMPSPFHLKYVKGSHIVIPKACLNIHNNTQAYFLQHPDRRIVFVIPFEKDYLMIGTTDIDFQGDPEQVQIDASEIDYLCQIVNTYFESQITAKDVTYTWSGLRVLVSPKNNNNPILSKLSRDYKIEYAGGYDKPIISVFGGKLTTYRSLSEKIVNSLSSYFRTQKLSSAWTGKEPLPGGDIEKGDLQAYQNTLNKQYPDLFPLQPKLLERYVTQYGTRIEQLLQSSRTLQDLGKHFGHGLYEREVQYMCDQEWALTAEDILWRRTKLGLVFSPQEREQLEAYLTRRSGRSPLA